MHRGNLNDLLVFPGVGQERGFTRAAARTQSSGRNSRKLLQQYPDIKVEIIIDYGPTDLVAERFDAGLRSSEQVAKDMLAVRIGSDMRSAVVGP